MEFKIFKNRLGFSLIELMVVVAIMSILAAVGIASYSKYKMKARDSEAQAALGVLFSSQRIFYSEYNFYHTNLQAIGFSMQGNLYFNVGFGNPTNVIATDYGYEAPVDPNLINTKAQCSGANGTGTSTECRFVVDVPDLPFLATTFPDAFFATAASTPSNYANHQGAPVGMSRMQMFAEFFVVPREANASLAITEANCHWAMDNAGSLAALLIHRRCLEEGLVQRRHLTLNPLTRLWTVSSKKIFRNFP